MKTSKRTKERRRMILDLDGYARRQVLSRDEYTCIWCGSDRSLQWAHVLSRRHLRTRWLVDNGMTLCAGCHLKWHHEPAVALEWFFRNYMDRWHRITPRNGAIEDKVTMADIREMWSNIQ